MTALSVSSASSVRIPAPPPASTPAGAEWASAFSHRLSLFGRSVWAELERAGHRRAQRHVELLGLQYPLLSQRTEALRVAMQRDAETR